MAAVTSLAALMASPSGRDEPRRRMSKNDRFKNGLLLLGLCEKSLMRGIGLFDAVVEIPKAV